MSESDRADRPATHEADPADVAEQQTPINEDDDAATRAEFEEVLRRSPEAPEADVSEQAIEVVDDEEDWR